MLAGPDYVESRPPGGRAAAQQSTPPPTDPPCIFTAVSADWATVAGVASNGYLGFNGNLDLAIAIRTGVVKAGELHVQAAAGIVADSIPQQEWLETRNKARAMLAAAELVNAGLDAPPA